MDFLEHPAYHHFQQHHHEQLPNGLGSYGDSQQALHNYSNMMPPPQPSPVIPVPHSGTKSNETKPRLGKAEVETLEQEFSKNPKPTTNTKRQYAEQMNVDLARINNWFQNRRAKRKQEKKQQAYEAQTQDAAGESEPSSPDYFNTANGGQGFFGGPSVFLSTPPIPSSGPPPAAAPYNPNYSDPTGASLESLNRTMAAAAAAVSQSHTFDSFEGFTSFEGDRARFPTSDTSIPQFDETHDFSFATGFPSNDYTTPHLSITEIHNSPVETPTAFDHYSMPPPPTTESNDSQAKNALTSQLLSNQNVDGLTLVEENESQDAEDNSAVSPGTFADSNQNYLPAAPFVLKSPPASDIASRRKKAVKPVPLTSDTLKNRPSMGPRTLSYADGLRRPSDLPGSPMRRVMSAGGNRTMTGRINKSGADSAQRSPINFNGFSDVDSFMERNFHTTLNPPPLTVGSALNSSLTPPTPMSPRDMRGGEFVRREGSRSTASPNEGGRFLYDNRVPGGFQPIEGGQPLASTPPETPHSRLPFGPLNNDWTCGLDLDSTDQPLFTPHHDTFAIETQMPFPSYLTSMSQPVTPAFGQQFDASMMFQENDLTQYALNNHVEYSFPDTTHQQFSNGMCNSVSPMTKQKTFQFSNSTAADFHEKPEK